MLHVFLRPSRFFSPDNLKIWRKILVERGDWLTYTCSEEARVFPRNSEEHSRPAHARLKVEK